MSKSLIVIPARYNSSRFPGKPLCEINNVTMLERIWNIAKEVKNVDETLIATDDERIAELCTSINANYIMTSKECRTGSDRVLEAYLSSKSEAEIVFSFQGDSVLTPPWIIESVLDEMKSNSEIKVCTPAVLLKGSELNSFVESKKRGSSTGTSVTFDKNMDALYFSKSLIPNLRSSGTRSEEYTVYKHIGLYAYRKDTLVEFSKLKQSEFEKIEQLEQLRLLENGYKVRIKLVDLKGRTLHSVDNPEDVKKVEEIISKEGELL